MKEELIKALSLLGEELKQGSKNSKLQDAIRKSISENTWFSIQDIDFQLKAIALWLKEKVLQDFVSNYSFAQEPKKIAVICAGNIPCCAFHDLLCVLLSGNAFLAKLSSEDKYLLPQIFSILSDINPKLKDRIAFTQERINNSQNLTSLFSGIIATGSNNTSLYFEYYFKDVPHIIRHSRSSIAVLTNEDKDFSLLMQDILTHKQRGCRNVCKLFIPNDFSFEPLAKATLSYSFLLDENCYRNNYDYHKAIFTMNGINCLDTSVLLFFECENLFAPVSVVNYQKYSSLNEVNEYIAQNAEQIQCVVSQNKEILNAIPLGDAQKPLITDFEDRVNTMKWLCNL